MADLNCGTQTELQEKQQVYATIAELAKAHLRTSRPSTAIEVLGYGLRLFPSDGMLLNGLQEAARLQAQLSC